MSKPLIRYNNARIDPNSETWHHVRDVFEVKLQQAREDNDAISLTEAQTAALRGRIEAYKEVLELTKPAPEIEGFSDDAIY